MICCLSVFANLSGRHFADLVHSLFHHSSWFPFWRSLWPGRKWEKTRVLQRFPKAISWPWCCNQADCLAFSSLCCGLPEFLKWWLGLISSTGLKLFLFSWRWISACGLLLRHEAFQAVISCSKGQTEAGFSIGLAPSLFGESFLPCFSSCSSQYNDCYSQSHAGCLYLYDYYDVMGAGIFDQMQFRELLSGNPYGSCAYCGIALVISSLSRLLEKSLETKGGKKWI